MNNENESEPRELHTTVPISCTDGLIRKLYSVAAVASRRANDEERIRLHNIITEIAEARVTTCDQLKMLPLQQLQEWYAAMKMCDSLVEDGAFAHLGPVQTLLEYAVISASDASATIS